MQVISLLIFTPLSFQVLGMHFRIPIENMFETEKYTKSSVERTGLIPMVESQVKPKLILPFPVKEEIQQIQEEFREHPDFYSALFPRLRVDNIMTERHFIKHLEDLADFLTITTNMNVEFFDPSIL